MESELCDSELSHLENLLQTVSPTLCLSTILWPKNKQSKESNRLEAMSRSAFQKLFVT